MLAKITDKYKKIFDLSPDVIVLLDTKKKIVDVNRRIYDWLGYESKEVIGKTISELPFLPEKSKLIAKECFSMRIRGKEILRHELDLTTKKGEIRVGVITGLTMKDENEKIIGELVMITDITDRKQAEEAITCSTAEWEKTFDAVLDIITLISPDFEFLKINRAGYESIGKRPEELIGKKCYEVIHGLDVPIDGCPCVNARKTKKASSGEMTDHGRHYIVTASPILNKNNELEACVHTIKDITERKKTEEALQGSERKYKTIVENINDALIIHDFNGKIIDVNEIACKLFGSKRDSIIGKNVRKFTTEELHTTTAQRIKKVIREKSLLFETGIRTSDKSIIPVSVSAKLVSKQSKGIIQSFVRDITERKRADEKINHLNLVLRTVRNVNQLIAQRKESGRLLKDICNTLTENRGYYHAWIVLLDKGGKCVMSAEAGLNKRFVPILKKLKGGELPVCGQKALRQSNVVIIKNPRAICVGCSLAETIRNKVAMAVRLEYGGKIYGVLSVSIPAGFIADKEEHVLFKEVAGDIAFALHNIELEEERKRIEKALHESEQKYRTLVESATDFIYMIDKNDKVLSVNKAAARVFGKSPTEIIGESIFNLFPEEIATNYARDLKKVFETCNPSFHEAKMVAGERESWISVSLSPVKDQEGNVVAVMGVTRDITERKKAEEELKNSEQRFRTIFDQANDGILVADIKDKKFITGNKMICRMLGYTIDEIKDLGVMNIHPEEHLPYVIAQFEKQQKGEIKVAKEIPVKTKKGNVFYADINSTPIIIDGKQCLLGFFRDITERKQTEDKIKQQHELLNNTLESLTHPFYVIDANDYTIKLANSAAYQAILPNGLTCYALGHKREKPCSSTEHPCPLEEVKRTKRPVVVEHVHYDENGNAINVEVHGYPIFDNEGNVVQMIEYCLNITERKKAEEELKKKNEELKRFNKIAVGRELKMVELKCEINKLAKEAGKEPPYDLSFVRSDDEGGGADDNA